MLNNHRFVSFSSILYMICRIFVLNGHRFNRDFSTVRSETALFIFPSLTLRWAAAQSPSPLHAGLNKCFRFLPHRPLFCPLAGINEICRRCTRLHHCIVYFTSPIRVVFADIGRISACAEKSPILHPVRDGGF